MRTNLKVFAIILLFTIGCASAQTTGEISVAKAREIAFKGKEYRPQAEAMLKQILADDPDNGDALTLYGTLLSWDGNYDEARRQLQKVLDKNPSHGDALSAMINVELWSDHPARAEELANQALQRNPKDVNMLMFEARAQRNQAHYKKAISTLDKVLALEPSNKDALEMKRRITTLSWGWEGQVSYDYEYLTAGYDAQQETQVSLRGTTKVGSVIGRVSRADRFGEHSWQIEGDMYPHFRPGTYGYINVGFSPDGNLYPNYRFGADLYQSVGHGFELSGGYRYLDFSTGTNMATAAVYKYWRNWLYFGRVYITPDSLGTSTTEVFGARYFFGSEGLHDYFEARFSYGNSLALATTTNDLIGLNTTRGSLEYDKTFGHWATDFKFSAGKEDQAFGGKVNRYVTQFSLYYRF